MNLKKNGLSNENLFEYNQSPSKKPLKDNLTTKFNLLRYRIITTQKIKTRIQKLKKQSHHSRNPPRDKETKKSSKKDSILFNTQIFQFDFYNRYKSVFIDLTKPLGWSYTLFTKEILNL